MVGHHDAEQFELEGSGGKELSISKSKLSGRAGSLPFSASLNQDVQVRNPGSCKSGTLAPAPACGALRREWWHCLDVFFWVCIFEWTCSLSCSERTGTLLVCSSPVTRPGVLLKTPVAVKKIFWNLSRNRSPPSAAGALTVHVRQPRWLVTTF